MIIGWVTNKAVYEKCAQYMRGDLPGPRPLPGFTAKHRAQAIASLSKVVTPRVLEMTWKTIEYGDPVESSALFGALAQLQDQRAAMPMIELIEERSSTNVQTSAINVLSRLSDPRGLDLLLQLANDPKTDRVVRLSAIRAIGRYDDARASEALTGILLRKGLADDERLAAAEGLGTRLDPKTRPAVLEALGRTWNQDALVALVGILGEIGTREDIPALQRAAKRGKLVEQYVEDAIEDIESRK
jgi:HEAT repeat protein